MNTQPKFYYCDKCKNVAVKAYNAGPALFCCGEKMSEMVAGSTDAAQEKHVPFVTLEGNKVTVQVGEVVHPMTQEHHIGFILLQTDKATTRVDLDHTQEPKAEFTLGEGEKAIAVYEFCNLHGLWKKDLV